MQLDRAARRRCQQVAALPRAAPPNPALSASLSFPSLDLHTPRKRANFLYRQNVQATKRLRTRLGFSSIATPVSDLRFQPTSFRNRASARQTAACCPRYRNVGWDVDQERLGSRIVARRQEFAPTRANDRRREPGAAQLTYAWSAASGASWFEDGPCPGRQRYLLQPRLSCAGRHRSLGGGR